jgi:hypothetical protein
MAQSTTTIESVWAAKGNLPDNAIVATADGKYPALDGSLITNVGAGDLLAANNLSELTATASVARTNLELGAADTVEFGGFVPPSGTTVEIDAVTTATIGQVMVDADNKRQVRFTGASTYEYIGSAISRTIYFVDPDNGDDARGSGGYFPFATINAALKAAVIDGQSAISVNCLPAVYTEQDAFNGVVTTSIISINFEVGSLWSGAAQTLPMFDNTTANLNIYEITGSLSISDNNSEWWKGPFYSNGTNISLLSSVSWSASGGPTINVTGGRGTISIALKCVSTSVRVPFLKVSGDADVDLNYLRFELPASAFSTVPVFSELSGTATLKMKDSTFKGYGLCEITTDTACKLILSNSASAATAGPSQTLKSVVAPAASSNPTAYAFGSNAADVAASNISVNVDLGTFTVSATTSAIV